ncbi:MAG: lipocalin-like domain-containing protein [Sphingomonadaceae bacterium]|nr:lipocalin-like domain-containing protein [Sphingomonadaceae bacterium]
MASDASAMQPFIGSWELVDFIRTSSAGETDRPLGAVPAGLISYTADGTVSVHLVATDGRPGRLMPEYSGYYGAFRVDTDRQVVIHDIEQASHEWLRGTQQVRQYAFDGDRLTLSAAIDEERMELSWQRRFTGQ